MAEALYQRASVTPTRAAITHVDDGTSDGKATVAAVLGLAEIADVSGLSTALSNGLERSRHTGTQTASTISDFASASRAQTEAELVAGTNVTITPSGTGDLRQLTIAATAGGSADDFDIVATANPASPYTAASLAGNTVVKITALAGNLTINKPTGTFGTGKRFFVVYDVTASGADRTITWGTGIALGLGVAPSLVIASGTTARFTLYTDDNASNFLYDGDFALATETLAGRIEVATLAEVNAGTDTGRAVAPDQLAGSYAATKAVSLQITAAVGDDHVVGDGQAWFLVPASLNGMDLVSVLGVVANAGTTGTAEFQMRRVRGGTPVDMLSTKLTIDSTETSSATAAVAAVINTSNDDVATGDLIYLDVDAVQTTKAKGGAVALEFRRQ